MDVSMSGISANTALLFVAPELPTDRSAVPRGDPGGLSCRHRH